MISPPDGDLLYQKNKRLKTKTSDWEWKSCDDRMKAARIGLTDISRSSSFCQGLSNPIEEITQSDDEVADVAISSIPIEELGLSVRAYNALKRSKRYNTIGDFSTASYSDLCKVRNLGRRSIIETLERLEKYGVNVKRIRDQIAESDRRRQE